MRKRFLIKTKISAFIFNFKRKNTLKLICFFTTGLSGFDAVQKQNDSRDKKMKENAEIYRQNAHFDAYNAFQSKIYNAQFTADKDSHAKFYFDMKKISELQDNQAKNIAEIKENQGDRDKINEARTKAREKYKTAVKEIEDEDDRRQDSKGAS